MRRIVATLAVIALLLAAMAAPAFAVANPDANCVVGEVASQLNQPDVPEPEPGSGGEIVSDVAREGSFGEATSTNCGKR
jgi:hypothetical protein